MKFVFQYCFQRIYSSSPVRTRSY